MQELDDLITLTTEWTALSDLITIGDEPIYVQNQGGSGSFAGVMRICEGDSEPTGTAGDIVLPNQRITFTRGEQNDLFMKSEQGEIKINITKAK